MKLPVVLTCHGHMGILLCISRGLFSHCHNVECPHHLKTFEFNDVFLLHALGHLRTQVTFSFSIEGAEFVCLHL